MYQNLDFQNMHCSRCPHTLPTLTYLRCKRLEQVGPSRTPHALSEPQPPHNPAGACMQAGVVGSKREHGTRTEQSLQSTGACICRNPQRESIGVGVFSLNKYFRVIDKEQICPVAYCFHLSKFEQNYHFIFGGLYVTSSKLSMISFAISLLFTKSPPNFWPLYFQTDQKCKQTEFF